MIFSETSTVLQNNEIAQNIYEAHLSSLLISKNSKPGQFINILPSKEFNRTMRRPMSISYQDNESVKIIYKPIGHGTDIMASWRPGDMADIIGPLGNQWEYNKNEEVILIGGGVGIAPIMNLYNSIEDKINVSLFIGARMKNEHFLNHNPERKVYLSTDDGSLGIKGNLFEAMNEIYKIDELMKKTLYVCGPPLMMETIRRFSVDNGIGCYLALETIMACGIGICQGCTVEKCIKDTNSDGSYRNKYELVCMDGPIYEANEITTCLL